MSIWNNGKWKICCVCDNGQDFGNFEESVSRDAIWYNNLNLLLEERNCPNVLATNFFFINFDLMMIWKF